ncbi:hypothetical protein HAZT_HAZT008520 [Hyalella azteca]|uniref:Phosphatase and actin regulator n=1 Tax=Hyalella azteca TaxID=294128 RepID=A0A6A0H7E7_HYAAZ|nr:hypothetical protein HAZT_HAZT008520 [Hyalella azteca]
MPRELERPKAVLRALKVKLMLRRPREDLVSRGVIPPMNTPAAFYEQRQRLDMAKKHDILKHKMQKRPDREELVRQHILEGGSNMSMKVGQTCPRRWVKACCSGLRFVV